MLIESGEGTALTIEMNGMPAFSALLCERHERRRCDRLNDQVAHVLIDQRVHL